MRKKLDQEYIEKELGRVGAELKEDITVYLIGGGAMALQGMKDATKDIDIVVINNQDFQSLIKTLKKSNYSDIEEMEPEYKELGAKKILENEEGCRFDIFNQQVVDKLIFSDSMQNRSKALRTKDKLQIEITSPEDIFLFKSVAGRTTDIEDMNTLIQSGLDFQTIAEEIETQANLLDEELFITHIGESLNKLQKKHKTTTPLSDILEDRITSIYNQLEILTKLNGETNIDKLKKNTGMSQEKLEKALNSLEENSNVEIEGKKVKETKEKKL
ncbi:MAG: hypothetical protein MUP58_03130 [Candidatus Nanohaloarchaeota archaeon QJJ-9]|nr:hypothetical protein [Candidatus Nanohaloarchaeota archaeon QJJ-9]